MIILLNGVSSSGKSSIAKALQHLNDKPLLHIGIDTFFQMLPVQYVGYGNKASQGFSFINQGDGGVRVETGSYGKKLCNTMVQVIKLMADQGHDMVVDEVLLSVESMQKYKNTFEGYPIFYIGVHIELNDLLEREILRGDRAVGLGQEQLNRVHHIKYDFEVNTSYDTSFACAKKILEYITKNMVL